METKTDDGVFSDYVSDFKDCNQKVLNAQSDAIVAVSKLFNVLVARIKSNGLWNYDTHIEKDINSFWIINIGSSQRHPVSKLYMGGNCCEVILYSRPTWDTFPIDEKLTIKMILDPIIKEDERRKSLINKQKQQ